MRKFLHFIRFLRFWSDSIGRYLLWIFLLAWFFHCVKSAIVDRDLLMAFIALWAPGVLWAFSSNLNPAWRHYKLKFEEELKAIGYIDRPGPEKSVISEAHASLVTMEAMDQPDYSGLVNKWVRCTKTSDNKPPDYIEDEWYWVAKVSWNRIYIQDRREPFGWMINGLDIPFDLSDPRDTNPNQEAEK